MTPLSCSLLSLHVTSRWQAYTISHFVLIMECCVVAFFFTGSFKQISYSLEHLMFNKTPIPRGYGIYSKLKAQCDRCKMIPARCHNWQGKTFVPQSIGKVVIVLSYEGIQAECLLNCIAY